MGPGVCHRRLGGYNHIRDSLYDKGRSPYAVRGKCLSGTVAVSGPGPSDTASPMSLGRISEMALAGSPGWLSALTKGSTAKQEASTGAAEEGNEEAGPEGRGHVPFHWVGPRAEDQPLSGAGGAGLLDPGCAPLPLRALLVGS